MRRALPRLLRALTAAVTLAAGTAGCRSTPPQTAAEPASQGAAAEAVRPLAGLATVPVVLTPVQTLRGGDPMGWASRIVSREVLRSLDAEIAYVLRERGLDSVWRLPERLQADLRRNPTIGVALTGLSVEPLRAAQLKIAQRIGEPLATQLRALVALHDGRLALVPVEVRFVPEGTPAAGAPASGRAVLRLVLVDARLNEIKWVGEVRSDPSTSPSKAVEATLAQRLGDLVAAP